MSVTHSGHAMQQHILHTWIWTQHRKEDLRFFAPARKWRSSKKRQRNLGLFSFFFENLSIQSTPHLYMWTQHWKWRAPLISGSRGGALGARALLAPKISSKSCSCQAILREKPLFWANFGLRPPLWGPNSAGPPWPKSQICPCHFRKMSLGKMASQYPPWNIGLLCPFSGQVAFNEPRSALDGKTRK